MPRRLRRVSLIVEECRELCLGVRDCQLLTGTMLFFGGGPGFRWLRGALHFAPPAARGGDYLSEPKSCLW